MSQISSKVPSWALLMVFLFMALILAIFGDLFTFITGVIIIGLIFISGYDKEHIEKY